MSASKKERKPMSVCEKVSCAKSQGWRINYQGMNMSLMRPGPDEAVTEFVGMPGRGQTDGMFGVECGAGHALRGNDVSAAAALC